MKRSCSILFFTTVCLLLLQKNFVRAQTVNIYSILERAGILDPISQTTQLVKMYAVHNSNINKIYQSSEYKKFIFDYLNNSLSAEEVTELDEILQNPFVTKISRIFFQPIEDRDRFDIFIKRFGTSAIKEKVELLGRLQKILLTNSTQPFIQITLDRMIRVITIKEREEKVDKKKTLAEYEKMAIESTKESEKIILQNEQKELMQYLYYRAKNITIQDLKYFLQKYDDNQTLRKFYKNCRLAKIQYFKNISAEIINN